MTKTENSCIFNGIHYVEEEPYDEVIVKTGSDDLPPSVSEGAIHYFQEVNGYERKTVASVGERQPFVCKRHSGNVRFYRRRDSENIGGDGSGWRDLRISYADQLG